MRLQLKSGNWGASAVLFTFLVGGVPSLSVAQGSEQSHPQENIIPSPDIPTSTYDPAEELNPKKARQKKLTKLLAGKRYPEFIAEYSLAPSSFWATSLGWAYYDDHRLSDAQIWFQRALSLDPKATDASKGLSLIKQGLAEGKTLGRRKPGNVWVDKAYASFDRKDYRKTIDDLSQAEKKGVLERDPEVIRGWSYFHLGDYSRSAEIFTGLYQRSPDHETAEGLLLSRARLDQWEELGIFAEKQGGPLRDLYRQARAQDFYDRGLFLAAENCAPGFIPPLKYIYSPSISLGGGFSEKSGDRGLSRLRAIYGPVVETKIVFQGIQEFSFAVQRLDLDSGHLNPNALFGSAPMQLKPYSSAPQTELDDLVIPVFRYHRDGWTAPYAELSSTPLNAPVSPLPTGRVGVVQQNAAGYMQGGLFSRSITESLLSYSGAIDPYTGKSFGRVIETGVEGSAYHDLGEDWGLFGSGTAGWLIGEQVQDNEHVGGSLSVAKNLKLDHFKYFSVGPVVSLDHYENDSSHFTLGQGGYFSPVYLAQGLGALNFLTEEGKQFIVRGNTGVGAQVNQQAASDFFPLSPDGRRYAGSEGSSAVFNINLEGVARLSDHWQVGGELGYDKSASYERSVGFIFFRYLFEPRPAVFSTDLSHPVP